MHTLHTEQTSTHPADTALYRGLNVFALAADIQAVGHYRLMAPLRQLSALGASCRIVTEASVADAMDADIILVQRVHTAQMCRMVESWQRLGKAVFHECDDLLPEVPPSSPAYAFYGPHTRTCELFARAFLGSAGATFSTPDLAAMCRGFAPNQAIIPNCIDFTYGDWTTRPHDKPSDVVIVAWAGGTTHADDLELLREPILELLRRCPQVLFALYSFRAFAEPILADWGLPADRCVVMPAQTLDHYPGGLGYVDIGLAPLLDTPFNRAKSNLKVLEYGARRIPCVASRVAPYVGTIRHGENGLLADTAHEWVESIATLVEDVEKRRAMGERMHADVRADYDLQRGVHRWPAAWRQLCQGAGLPVPAALDAVPAADRQAIVRSR